MFWKENIYILFNIRVKKLYLKENIDTFLCENDAENNKKMVIQPFITKLVFILSLKLNIFWEAEKTYIRSLFLLLSKLTLKKVKYGKLVEFLKQIFNPQWL